MWAASAVIILVLNYFIAYLNIKDYQKHEWLPSLLVGILCATMATIIAIIYIMEMFK